MNSSFQVLVSSERQSHNRTSRDPEDYRIIPETLFRVSDLVTNYTAIGTRYGLSFVTEDTGYTSQVRMFVLCRSGDD